MRALWQRFRVALRAAVVAFRCSWTGKIEAPPELRTDYPLVPAQGFAVVWWENGHVVLYEKDPAGKPISGTQARDKFANMKKRNVRVDFFRNGARHDHWAPR